MILMTTLVKMEFVVFNFKKEGNKNEKNYNQFEWQR